MPITEIKVDSIQNIKQLIIETQKDDTIGRYRSPALFRGLPNSTYTLQTSLYRNCKEKSIELETSILRNFYKYALPTANHDSCWERMVAGQHHGLDGLELLTIDCTAFCNEWGGFYCNGST